jgi:hypothetical protein
MGERSGLYLEVLLLNLFDRRTNCAVLEEDEADSLGGPKTPQIEKSESLKTHTHETHARKGFY